MCKTVESGRRTWFMQHPKEAMNTLTQYVHYVCHRNHLNGYLLNGSDTIIFSEDFVDHPQFADLLEILRMARQS